MVHTYNPSYNPLGGSRRRITANLSYIVTLGYIVNSNPACYISETLFQKTNAIRKTTTTKAGFRELSFS